jgi:PST family polysaccharide transporter
MLRIFLSLGLLQAATLLVLLVRTKVLAVLLGPEQVGMLGVVDRLVALFAQTASLSMGFAALRFLSPLWSRDPRAYRALLLRMRNLLLLTLTVATAVGIALTLFAPTLLGRGLAADRRLLLAAFATVPVVGLIPLLQNARAARLEPARSMAFLFSHALVFAASAILGVLWSGLAGLYTVYAAAGLVFVAWSLARLGRTADLAAFGSTPPPPHAVAPPAPGLPREVWRFSLSLWALAALTPFAALFASYRLLRFHGAAAAGWMQAALGLALAVRTILGAANEVFLTPNVNRQASFEERAGWAAGFVRTQAVAIGLAVAPVVLFADLAVRLLYSPAFAPGTRYVTLFVLAETVGLVGGVAQSIVVAMDQMRVHVALNLASQVLLVAVAFELVPRWGIGGVGAAMLGAYLFMLVSPLVFLKRRYGWSWSGSTFLQLGFVLSSLAALGWLGRIPFEPLWESLAIRATAYLAFAFILLAFRSREERAALRGLLSGLVGRGTARGAP